MQDRSDADTYDLLGYKSFGGAGRLGPIYRKKASQEKLSQGYRDRRVAEEAYAKDPSEDNRLALHLANLFVRASEKEDEANQDDIVVNTLAPGGVVFPSATLVGGIISTNQKFQDCADLWLQYDRVKRQILIHQRQEATQTTQADAGASNTVAQRMLSLSNYGPQSQGQSSTPPS